MNRPTLIAALAATAAFTTTAGAVGVVDYLTTFQELNTVIPDGVDQEGDPVFAYKDNQFSSLPTDQSFSFNASSPGASVTSSLNSTLGTEAFGVDLVQNIESSLDGTPLGSAGISFEFKVSQTTAFEATGSLAMLAGVPDTRCYLKEVGGADLFNFTPANDGSAHPFSFSGILEFDKTYLLQFALSADGNRTSSGTLSFALTGAPIPEPETYAALAGLALAGFWVVRRNRNSHL